MSTPETVEPGTDAPPDVGDMLTNIVASVRASTPKPTACVVLMLDSDMNWAGAVSGLSLEDLSKALLCARDDAVRGGKGFMVVVNQPHAANDTTPPERINGTH